jgi:hypothetical protein
MLIYMHQQFVLEAIMDKSPSQNSSVSLEHLPDLETMDGVLAVLSLINMAELANVLHPDTYQEGVDPEERVFLIHVRKQARDLLHWLNNHYSIDPAPRAGTVLSTTNQTPHLEHSYLVHQVRALQDAKMSMEEAGLQSAIPGLTYQALHVQVVGCLGGPASGIQGRAETFAWDKESYKVSRRRKPLQTQFRMCTFHTFTKPVV